MTLVLQLLLALEGGDVLHLLLHDLHLLGAVALQDNKYSGKLQQVIVTFTLAEVVI